MQPYNIRNIGILAHVDAGKTTLTEQLLLHTGTIAAAGRVDMGTAHTDQLPIERQRGISIRSQAACITYQGIDIRIIDTPGHVDFSKEVEYALLALDGAVLVISAVEGVQVQTEAIAAVLRAMRIPIIIFINKIDRVGADVPAVTQQLRALGLHPLSCTEPSHVLDTLTRLDDALMEQALEDRVTEEDIRRSSAQACAECQVQPLLVGAALKGQGVEALLKAIIDYLPPPIPCTGPSLAVYHVTHTPQERQAHVRVFGGSFRFGQSFDEGRIIRLRRLTSSGFEPTEALEPGDIGQVVGLHRAMPGTWLGLQLRGQPELARPFLYARVDCPAAQLPTLQSALVRLTAEQPELSPRFEPQTRQWSVQIMGEIHRQVLQQTLRDEFMLDIALDEPSVLYRETPVGVGVGSLDMFFSPWYARLTFEVKHGAPGSGIVYRSQVHVDTLMLKYQRDIEMRVLEALQEGLHGWPVTDIEVSLIGGQSHTHTRPGSRFGLVVPLGLFDALKNAGTRLLEPMTAFEAHLQPAQVSRFLYDMTQCRAMAAVPVIEQDMAHVAGRGPAVTILPYAQTLRELTGGRGGFSTRFDGYAPCPEGLGAPRERTTPDPSNPELYMRYINGVVRE